MYNSIFLRPTKQDSYCNFKPNSDEREIIAMVYSHTDKMISKNRMSQVSTAQKDVLDKN